MVFCQKLLFLNKCFATFTLQTCFSFWPLKICYLLTWSLIKVQIYGPHNTSTLCLFIWPQLISNVGALSFVYLSMVLLVSFSAKRVIPLISMVKKKSYLG